MPRKKKDVTRWVNIDFVKGQRAFTSSNTVNEAIPMATAFGAADTIGGHLRQRIQDSNIVRRHLIATEAEGGIHDRYRTKAIGNQRRVFYIGPIPYQPAFLEESIFIRVLYNSRNEPFMVDFDLRPLNWSVEDNVGPQMNAMIESAADMMGFPEYNSALSVTYDADELADPIVNVFRNNFAYTPEEGGEFAGPLLEQVQFHVQQDVTVVSGTDIPLHSPGGSHMYTTLRVLASGLDLRSLPSNAKKKFVESPARVMRGGCLRSGWPSGYLDVLDKYLVHVDPVDADPSISQWNCGIRCLLKFFHNYDERLTYNALCKMASGVRKHHREIPQDGPLSSDDLACVAKELQINLLVGIWNKGLFERYEWQFGENYRECHLILINEHYHLVPTRKNWDYITLEHKLCYECSSRFKHVDHECKQKKKRKAPCDLESAPPLKSLMPYNGSKLEDRPTDDEIWVADFETRRMKVYKGDKDEQPDYHVVYAAGLKQGLEDASKGVTIDYGLGDDPMKAFCKRFIEIGRNTKPGRKNIMFFYNGSGFDCLLLSNYLISEEGIGYDKAVIKNGKMMSLSYFNERLIILDAYLFTTCSLKEACESYGVSQDESKTEFDHDLMVSDEAVMKHKDEVCEYLRLDLVATSKVIKNLRDILWEKLEVELCEHITMSQLAYNAWRKSLNASTLMSIKLPQTGSDDALMREAYWGGRVFPQVMKWVSENMGEEYVKILKFLRDLDVNSLYPTAMAGSEKLKTAWGTPCIPKFFAGNYKYYHERQNDPLFEGLRSELFRFQEEMDHPKIRDPKFLQRNAGNIFELYRGNNRLLKVWNDDQFDLKTRGGIVWVDIEPPNNLNTELTPFADKKGGIRWTLEAQSNAAMVLDELIESMIYGYRISNVRAGFLFDKRIDPYKKHIGKAYAMKKQYKRGQAGRDVAKHMMNDVYGKNAQEVITVNSSVVVPEQMERMLREGERNIIDITPVYRRGKKPKVLKVATLMDLRDLPTREDIFAAQREHKDDIVGYKVDEASEHQGPTKAVYLAAQITANSRMIMNRCLLAMGLLFDPKKQKKYSDTDSIFAEQDAVETIQRDHPQMVGDDLGQLSDELEGGKITGLWCLAPKFYCSVYAMWEREKGEDGKPIGDYKTVYYLKIRTKGLPHTKDKIIVDETLFERASEGISEYLTEDGTEVDPKKNLPFKTYIYKMIRQDGTFFFSKFLHHHIFDAIITGEIVSIEVTFSTMKRRYNNENGVEMCAVEHARMSRKVASMTWWKKEDAPRRHNPENTELTAPTYPRGHYLLSAVA